VPLVEANVLAGEAVLPIFDVPSDPIRGGALSSAAMSGEGDHDRPFRLSGGICFDLDYTDFMLGAGRKRVDLFLQPSWTWNAISSRHLEGDAVRAIENGFTLFRCSSTGESGVVGPNGLIHQRQFTGGQDGEVALFSIPITYGNDTVYASCGFAFEYVLLAFGLWYYYMILRWVTTEVAVS
jgi:apolipoprotein N-acyltransferase